MTTPELKYAGDGGNDFSAGLSGNATWINPQNIVAEDGSTADVQLISPDVNQSKTSRILRSFDHHFNLPDGIDSIDDIRVDLNIASQTGGNQVRWFGALYFGGTGTVFTFNLTGSGPFFPAFSGSPASLGFASLTATDINSSGFGAAFVAHDSGSGSALCKAESIKITVTFSGAGLTYTERNDFFFGQGSTLLNGQAKATPYFINLGDETDGGAKAGGTSIPVGDQSAFGEGGAVLGGEAEVNPYFEVASGGAKAGGIGHQTYIEIISGGLLAGGIAPNGTHDFGSGGVLVKPHGNLQVESREAGGGIKTGGVGKATPYFIDLPGETDGGLVVRQGKAIQTYDEVGIGGIIIPAVPGHFFSFPPLFGEGGAKLGGESEVNPYFEVASGGVVLNGRSLNEVSWPGLPPFSLFNGSVLCGGSAEVTSAEAFIPDGGTILGGHATEFNTVESIGGALAGGKTLIAESVAIGDGSTLVGGLAPNQGVKTPIISGGAKVGGNFFFHYILSGTGGVVIEGEIDHPLFKLSYTPTGDSNITVENAESTADVLFSLFYTGDGEVLISGSSPLSASYIYSNVLGGVDVAGQSVNRATYDGYNVVLGDGFIIGSVSNTGIPHIFRAIRWPKGSIGRSLKSDNMFKTEMESLLITTITPNPDLCGLSTTDITQNKCQGAFVPPNLVNRQRQHLPSPKQEAKNRSSQLAKSG
jgi:hypothetical protein